MQEKYKLILVDDEPWALIGLEEIIEWEAMGFTVAARCECGQEALEAAEQIQPDAIITDIRMPDMSGIELYQRLSESHPGIVGAVVSAYADFEIAREAIKLSLLYYILKPLKADEVRDMAEKLRQKLDSRTTDGDVLRVDMQHPVFPVEAPAGHVCYLLLARYGEALDTLENSLNILGHVQMDGYSGLLTDSLPKTLPQGVGVSRPAYDFTNGEMLLREAMAALNGGFSFAQRTCSRQMSSAGDIQLYLYEHLTEDISLKRLAGKFYLSETYLCDMFKKQTGQSIFGFLKHIRLHRAKTLVAENTQLTFKEIAAMCGYQDYSYFGQQFKKETGMTPEVYRKLYGSSVIRAGNDQFH